MNDPIEKIIAGFAEKSGIDEGLVDAVCYEEDGVQVIGLDVGKDGYEDAVKAYLAEIGCGNIEDLDILEPDEPGCRVYGEMPLDVFAKFSARA